MRAPWWLDSSRSAHRVGETMKSMRFWECAVLSPHQSWRPLCKHMSSARGWSTGRGNRNGEPGGGKKTPHVLVQKEGCLRLADLWETAVHWSREPVAKADMVLEERRAEFWKQRNRLGMWFGSKSCGKSLNKKSRSQIEEEGNRAISPTSACKKMLNFSSARLKKKIQKKTRAQKGFCRAVTKPPGHPLLWTLGVRLTLSQKINVSG